MENIVIKTSRLCIEPRDITELEALYRNESHPEMKQAYADMINTVNELPGREEWGTSWKICLHSGELVGDLCFKGAPDSQGFVEIGYGIEPLYQQNGYALEAVGGMLNWAFDQTGVVCVTAQTEADNYISQKVLLGNGFIRDGEGEEGPLFKTIFSRKNSCLKNVDIQSRNGIIDEVN